jgi:pimeloyl-ACP methyl ester carboxylesterase
MLADWPQNGITANGAEFNYYRTPKTQGITRPALVLQHGFTDNGLCWAPVAEELAAEYDVIMPDARAHGHSARVAAGQDVDQAADLDVLLEALGVKQAVVAGHSMGASIAADLAARFPERVKAIVLEDPPWFLFGPEAAQRPSMADSPVGQMLFEIQDKSLDEVIAKNRKEHPTWPEPYLRAWSEGSKELDLNFLPQLDRPNPWQERVAAIRCPALLITANPGLGGLVTPDVERWVTETNPNFRIVKFPGVGHHVRFAAHSAFMQAFKAFLQDVA